VSAPATAAPGRLRAARVLRAHGVHGEVRVESLGGDPERFSRGLRLYPEGGGATLTVRSARGLDGGAVLLGFDEVRDTGAAGALQGAYLCVDASAARTLGADEWFVWQLVGLRAIDPEGVSLGIVEDVEAAVANDVLVVRHGEARRRFPMVREFVRRVDAGAGTVTIAPWDEDG
jgi:16S rRNA processing protein RimM